MKNLTAKSRKEFLFSVLTFLAAVIVLEFLLQGVSAAVPKVRRLLSPPLYMVWDAALEGRGDPRNPEYDQNGFRNPRVPDRAPVVILGDSQTYGTGVQGPKAWPRLLETALREPVYNMAWGGYGPTHHALLLDEALSRGPKLVIEALYTGNDFYESYAHVYEKGMLAELRSKDKRVLEALARAEREYPLTARIWTLFRLGIPHEEPGPLHLFLSRHSRLYGLLRAAWRFFRDRNKRDPWDDSDWSLIRKEAATHGAYLQVFQDQNAETVFRPAYRLRGLDREDPRILEGLRISLGAMRSMRQRLQAAHIQFAVLVLPTKELVFKESVYESGAPVDENYRKVVENEELITQRVFDYLKAEDIPVMDPLPVLRRGLRSGDQPYFRFADDHLNEAGHKAVAAFVDSEIQKHDWYGR